MDQTKMLHQMCHEVLADADIRAICKNRKLPAQAATSRPVLESLFLSEAGVAAALQALDPTERALLHLLSSQNRPVDVTFFSRLIPTLDRASPYGTFSQRFQGLFTKVKDRLVRSGLLLLALGRETATKSTKMERWEFALPVPFARHLPPLVESRLLSGEGDWSDTAAREKLTTSLRQGADKDTKTDRVEIVDDELRWGGAPFQAEQLIQWRQRQWQAETTTAKYRKQADSYTLTPAEAVACLLAGVAVGHWCDPAGLAVPLEIFSGCQVDAAKVCVSGWRWGFLAQQEHENRLWYRLAPPAAADVPPDRYLTVMGDEVAVDLDVVPVDALEILVGLSRQHPLPGERPLLRIAPDSIKIGRTADTVAELPLADWLQKHTPAFRAAFETVRQRRGKTILHDNLSVARVGDLSLKVALEKALGNRLVALSDEYVAFPIGALAEVKRLVVQLGHVVKEIGA